MHPLLGIILVIFVIVVPLNAVIHFRKHRKHDPNSNGSKLAYKRRIWTSQHDKAEETPDNVTKFNSTVDFRDPSRRDEYSDWE
jgi:hypothetical protein